MSLVISPKHRSICQDLSMVLKPANWTERAAIATTCALGMLGGWTYFFPALTAYSSIKFYRYARSKDPSPEFTTSAAKPSIKRPTVCILSSEWEFCAGNFLFNHKLALELSKAGQWDICLIAAEGQKKMLLPQTPYPILSAEDPHAKTAIETASFVVCGLDDAGRFFPGPTSQKAREGKCLFLREYSKDPRLTGPLPGQLGIFIAESRKNPTFFSLKSEELRDFLLQSGYAHRHFYFGYGHSQSLVNFISLAIEMERRAPSFRDTAIFLVPGTAYHIDFQKRISELLSKQETFSQVRIVTFKPRMLRNMIEARKILLQGRKIDPSSFPSDEEMKRMFQEDSVLKLPLFQQLFEPVDPSVVVQEYHFSEGEGILDVILGSEILHEDTQLLMQLSRAVHVTGDQSFSEAATQLHPRPWVYEVISHKERLFRDICRVAEIALGFNSHFVLALTSFREEQIEKAAFHLRKAKAQREYEAVSGYLIRNADLGRSMRKLVQDSLAQ